MYGVVLQTLGNDAKINKRRAVVKNNTIYSDVVLH
jgi:hypothetical protein